jgi:ATP-dependent exoDNAse (exonuclease V) beta subunit
MNGIETENLVIRASAGSGKTYRLTNRYLSLLAKQVPSSDIWAATFTRKAAGEILERIVSRLTDAAKGDENSKRLATAIGRPELTRDDCVRMLRDFLANLHRLRIGTLDSLFISLAQAFFLELGLPPGWRIVDEEFAAADREEALDQTLTGDDNRVECLNRLYGRLSRMEAKRAVRHDLLVLVKRLYNAYLTVPEEGWQTQPGQPHQNESVTSIIVEARSVTLPRDSRFQNAVTKNLSEAECERWLDFIESGLAKAILHGKNSYCGKPIPTELISCYKKLLDFARVSIQSELANETRAAWEFLDDFDKHFKVIKETHGRLRFDDIVRALAEKWKKLDTNGFTDRIGSPIHHLLLDEFQDTSTLQWMVLRPMAEQVINKRGSFFAVGDVKQAIYGWRGGRAELLDTLPEVLGDLRTEGMDESHRSARAIIDCVNKVFGSLAVDGNQGPVSSAVNDWRNRFKTHTTTRADRRGYVHVETGPMQIENEALADFRDRHYEWVAQQVKQIAVEKPTATIGILCRTNKAVGRIITKLRTCGIDASEEGKNPIIDSAAVEGILSLLTLADHPGNSIAAFHIAAEPFAKLLHEEKYDPADPSKTSLQIRTALMDKGYSEVITDWANRLKAICPVRDCLRLDQLIDFADAYQARATLRSMDFVTQVRQHKAAMASPSRVRVLTLHTAKGLEFDAVVLPELDVSLTGRTFPKWIVADPEPTHLPHGYVGRRANQELIALLNDEARKQTEAANRRVIEESFSLLYVALTRPREALYAFPPGPEKKNRPDCWDTLLMKALNSSQAGVKERPAETVVFFEGEKDWQPEKQTPARTTSAGPDTIRFGTPDPKNTRLKWVTPSQHVGKGKVSIAQMFANPASSGRKTGTLFHAWLADIEWLDDRELCDERLREIALQLPDYDDLSEKINSFRRALSQPSVRRIFSKCTYPDLVGVYRERPIAVRVGDQLVNGRIDRLLRLNDAAIVYDFKTDMISRDTLQERVEFYRLQVETYRQAVASLWNLDPAKVSAALVFTAIGHVESLNQL